MKKIKFSTKILLITLSILSSGYAVSANSLPDINYLRNIGGSGDDYLNSVVPTNDGGYLGIGYSNSTNGDIVGNKGSNDSIIAKFDSSGNRTWVKNYGGSGDDNFYEGTTTSDNGYIVVGTSKSVDGDLSVNKGGYDAIISKLDSSGNLIWKKNIGGSNSDYFYDVIQTNDGGYIAVGCANSANGDITASKGGADGIIVKFDSNGNKVWIKDIGGTSADAITGMIKADNGNFVIVGYTNSANGDITAPKGGVDGFIAKYDASGNKIWFKTIGGSSSDFLNDVTNTNDGGFVAVGTSWSTNGDITAPKGDFDAIATKFDANGNKVWFKNFGGATYDEFYHIIQTNDKGYMTVGTSTSSNGDITSSKGGYDAVISKLDPSGNLTWLKSIGGSGDDSLGSLISINNHYIAVGYSSSIDNDITNSKGGYDAITADLYFPNEITTKISIQPGAFSIVSSTVTRSFSSYILNRNYPNLTADLSSFNVIDWSGTGDGWNLTVMATPFTDEGGNKLPSNSLLLDVPTTITKTSSNTSPLPTTTSGTYSLNNISTKILTANEGEGIGEYRVNFNASALHLNFDPSIIKLDSDGTSVYTSTLTWALSKGP